MGHFFLELIFFRDGLGFSALYNIGLLLERIYLLSLSELIYLWDGFQMFIYYWDLTEVDLSHMLVFIYAQEKKRKKTYLKVTSPAPWLTTTKNLIFVQ